MIKASCLCAAVTFIIDSELKSVRYCHCENCRKFSGTSPASWAMAESAMLSVISGEQRISKFNSGRGIRCFCAKCGSPLWFESIDYPSIVGIPLGVLDSGLAPAPERHLWVESKPDWCEIADELPRHPEGPDTAPVNQA